jgi:hypothetical protein
MKTIQMSTIMTLALGLMTSAVSAALTLPYEGSVEEPGKAFRINNTYDGPDKSYGGWFEAAGAEGRGVYGRSTNSISGENTYGGFFYAAGPRGRGAFGQSAGAREGIGVKGWASHSGDVQNFGGHFCATGLRGVGVYGWAEHQGNGQNYGGFFLAEGNQGIGVFAMGGPNGCAGLFEGDIVISSVGNGIVFPDGSRQTTAATPTSMASSTGGVAACGYPGPVYDSGWVQMTSGDQSKELTHNLGGNPDDYTVDLQLKRDNIAGTINVTNKGIGQDFRYASLTTAKVAIFGPQHVGIDGRAWVRIRIWLCPSKRSSLGGGHE